MQTLTPTLYAKGLSLHGKAHQPEIGILSNDLLAGMDKAVQILR